MLAAVLLNTNNFTSKMVKIRKVHIDKFCVLNDYLIQRIKSIYIYIKRGEHYGIWQKLACTMVMRSQ